MSQAGNKSREQRLCRANELYGLVRKAFPLESWSDERCCALAAKLWCLGHVSVEALRTYLFENSFDPSPEKSLLDALAHDQRGHVQLYQLPATFEPYLSYECPCRQVEFLLFINYVRRVYDFDDAPAKGVACTAVRVGGVGAMVAGDSPGRNDGLAAMHAVIDAPGNGQAQGQGRRADTDEDMPRIKMAKDDVRYYDRFTYARRALRKVADELTCSVKDDFFKAVGLVVNS